METGPATWPVTTSALPAEPQHPAELIECPGRVVDVDRDNPAPHQAPRLVDAPAREL